MDIDKCECAVFHDSNKEESADDLLTLCKAGDPNNSKYEEYLTKVVEEPPQPKPAAEVRVSKKVIINTRERWTSEENSLLLDIFLNSGFQVRDITLSSESLEAILSVYNKEAGECGFADNLQVVLSIIGTGIPSEFLLMVPYIATIIAVSGFVGRVRAPAADGIPYSRGGSH